MMFRRQLYRRRHPLANCFLIPAVLGIGLAVLVIHSVNTRIRPIMTQLAITQVHQDVIEVLTQTVETIPLSYDEVVILEKTSDGQITALKSNMQAVNTYRSQLLARLSNAAGELEKRKITIPLGTLSGIDLLSGRGPGVPVKVLTVGQAKAGFENSFRAAGINQTRHQIILNLTVTANILLPGVTTQTDITTQICVAETVVVGAVPSHYFTTGDSM